MADRWQSDGSDWLELLFGVFVKQHEQDKRAHGHGKDTLTP